MWANTIKDIFVIASMPTDKKKIGDVKTKVPDPPTLGLLLTNPGADDDTRSILVNNQTRDYMFNYYQSLVDGPNSNRFTGTGPVPVGSRTPKGGTFSDVCTVNLDLFKFAPTSDHPGVLIERRLESIMFTSVSSFKAYVTGTLLGVVEGR